MLNVTLDSLGLETVRGDESFVSRVQDMPVSKEEFFDLTKMAKYVGVTAVSYTHLLEKSRSFGFTHLTL